MKIFITGGTGFIGKALVAELVARGHQLTVLTRQQLAPTQAVDYCQNFANIPDFNGYDAVINLAGEPIFDKRWTARQKRVLSESRVALTQKIVEKINLSQQPPHTFISGSATGFYGDFAKKGAEQTACGNGFASQLCAEWEAAAQAVNAEQTRLCLVRTGIVLGKAGGALARMLPLYRLGLGGKIGSGEQHWGWISLTDQVQGILFLLENAHCRGAFNFVAPTLVTQGEFNQTLAKLLYRPAFCAMPAWVLKLILGERAQLLLDNQPLVPQNLLDYGYNFRHSTLAEALADALLVNS